MGNAKHFIYDMLPIYRPRVATCVARPSWTWVCRCKGKKLSWMWNALCFFTLFLSLFVFFSGALLWSNGRLLFQRGWEMKGKELINTVWDLSKGFVWDGGSLWGDLRKPNLPPTEPFALHSQEEVQGWDNPSPTPWCFLFKLWFKLRPSFTSKTYICKKMQLWKRKIHDNKWKDSTDKFCRVMQDVCDVNNKTFTFTEKTLRPQSTGLLHYRSCTIYPSINLLLPTPLRAATITHTALVSLEGENPGDTKEPRRHE